jgi:hypothetical protein
MLEFDECIRVENLMSMMDSAFEKDLSSNLVSNLVFGYMSPFFLIITDVK